MAGEFSIGALLGVGVGLAADLFKRRYELRLANQRDVRQLVGEISAGVAKMIHLILWVTYRAPAKTIDTEISEYDRETHELIGLLVAAQAKLSIVSPDEFKKITPWITKAIKLSEEADETLAALKAKKRGSEENILKVNRGAMSLLKDFQAGMLGR
jgi:hypothetical protein